MAEIVIAVFEAASAADAAVRDLEVARIPSAVIGREISGDRERRDSGDVSAWQGTASAWHRKRCRGWPSVTVAVDEIHAAVVTGILNQYGPLEIEERSASSDRHGYLSSDR